MISAAKATGLPSRVRLAIGPAVVCAGIMARRPFAPAAAATVKPRELPFQVMEPNDDALRASSQLSICTLDTDGTPRARAEFTTASATEDGLKSVCAFTVYTP